MCDTCVYSHKAAADGIVEKQKIAKKKYKATTHIPNGEFTCAKKKAGPLPCTLFLCNQMKSYFSTHTHTA